MTSIGAVHSYKVRRLKGMDEVTAESPETRERGPWGPIGTIAFTLVIAGAFVLAQTAVGISYVLLTVREMSRTAIAAAAASLGSDGLFLGLSEVFSGATVLGLTLALAKLRKGPSVRDYLGFRTVPRATALRWLLYTLLLVVLLEAASQITGHASAPDWMVRIYRSAGSVPLLVFALLVVAPVVEETVFRGFLFEGLRRSWLGDVGTTLLASLAWAAIHVQYEAFYVGQGFCLGLLLGAARVRTASVVTPIAMHSLFNGVAMLQLALEVR